jgi:hypothetical protein
MKLPFDYTVKLFDVLKKIKVKKGSATIENLKDGEKEKQGGIYNVKRHLQ